MKSLLVFFLLFIISCASTPDDMSLCEEYCSSWEIAQRNEASVFNCDNTEEQYKDYFNQCETSCTNAYYSINPKFTENTNTCLECLVDNMDGEQRISDFDELVRGDNEQCASECRNGLDQFFASFFVIPVSCN